jgi:predicted TIM-barrel fold metal-dependent hydrolase
MDRVDAHAHVFASASADYPRAVHTLFPAERSATAEELMREMDGAGIERAVLIQLGGYGIGHHRYVAEAARHWSDRLAAVGLVDINGPEAVENLSALHEATGIRGIRLMGPLGPAGAASAHDLPAFAVCLRAAELGLNVNLYCPSDQVRNVEMIVRELPSVAFSMDHLGICPETAPEVDAWARPRFAHEPIPPNTYTQVLALAKYPNVHIKVSGEYAFSKGPYPYDDMRPMVQGVYRSFGPGRMMWCSDFPWIRSEPGYSRLADLIDHHLPDLDADARAAIMGGNAARLWFPD